MSMTSELYWLALAALATALMWIPYTAARIMGRGLLSALANPDSSHAPDSAWAERARRAHANAVENLVVFAPLVLVAALAGIGTPLTALAAKTYLFARLIHYFVYIAGIPVIRTLAFLVGVGATLVFAIALLGQ